MTTSSASWHFSSEQAEAIGSDWLQEKVRAEELYGEFDQNFLLTIPQSRRFVLKITTDAGRKARTLIDLQARMLEHLASRPLEVECPRPVRGNRGALYGSVRDSLGAEHLAWVLTYVEGRLLDEYSRYGDFLLTSLGRAVALVDSALRDFTCRGAERDLQWDVANAAALRPLTRLVAPSDRREIVEWFFHEFSQRILPELDLRPKSVIHNDGGNQHNMIVREPDGGPARVVGIIDFGDAVRTHTICGLGVAAAYATFGCEDPVHAVAQVAKGYHEVLSLARPDLDLVLWLAATRLAMSVCIAARRAADDPSNKYGVVSADPAWRVLGKMRALNFNQASREIRDLVYGTQ